MPTRIDTGLRTLIRHLLAYRKAMDRVFSEPMSDSTSCRGYFGRLLVHVLRLQLDSLVLIEKLSHIEVPPERSRKKHLVHYDHDRFRRVREQFETRLRSIPGWSSFDPGTPFAELTGLVTLDDYTKSFGLHLPEIYEATFEAEEYATRLLGGPSESAVAGLIVALEHMGRNHISFVQTALVWAADEGTWSS